MYSGREAAVRPPRSVSTGGSAVVPRPIVLPTACANQIAPSGPTVSPNGSVAATGNGYSVETPPGVILPMAVLGAVYQRLPSGAGVMSQAELPGVSYEVAVAPSPVMRTM